MAAIDGTVAVEAPAPVAPAATASTPAAPAIAPVSAPAQDAGQASGVKVVLYWLEMSRAHRILWLLEELKVPYEVKVFKRTKQKLAPPELKDVHAFGKSPVIGIQVPGQKELTIAESGSIVEYLIDHWGPQFKPKRYRDGQDGQIGAETEAFIHDRWYMHMSEGSLMPNMIFKLLVGALRGKSVPGLVRPLTGAIAGKIESSQLHPRIFQQLDYIESLTKDSGGPFLCGSSLTGSDFIMSYPLQGGQASGLVTKQKYPAISAWIDTIEARPAYKAAVQKTIEIDGEFGLFPTL